jgi:hypothetical protein
MKWEDPPAKGKRSSKWMKIFNELEENPGRWACLSEDDAKTRNSHSLAGRLRDKYGRNGEFEVISMTTGPGVAGVWARYLGPEELDDPVEAEDWVARPPTWTNQDTDGGGAGL